MCTEIGTEQIVPKFMTMSELAAYTGFPIRCIRNMVNNGEIDSFRQGSRTIYVNVESFMAVCTGRNQK